MYEKVNNKGEIIRRILLSVWQKNYKSGHSAPPPHPARTQMFWLVSRWGLYPRVAGCSNIQTPLCCNLHQKFPYNDSNHQNQAFIVMWHGVVVSALGYHSGGYKFDSLPEDFKNSSEEQPAFIYRQRSIFSLLAKYKHLTNQCKYVHFHHFEPACSHFSHSLFQTDKSD